MEGDRETDSVREWVVPIAADVFPMCVATSHCTVFAGRRGLCPCGELAQLVVLSFCWTSAALWRGRGLLSWVAVHVRV